MANNPNRLAGVQGVASLLLTISNINWKGLKAVMDLIFDKFRKYIAGKTLFIVCIAALAGGLWYTAHTIGALRQENEVLSEQVELQTRARAADRLAVAVATEARAVAATEYEARSEALSEGAKTSPAWAAEELPPAIREALR